MAMTQADLDAIRARYAHYGTPKPGTAHADVVALLAEVERQRADRLMVADRLTAEALDVEAERPTCCRDQVASALREASLVSLDAGAYSRAYPLKSDAAREAFPEIAVVHYAAAGASPATRGSCASGANANGPFLGHSKRAVVDIRPLSWRWSVP